MLAHLLGSLLIFLGPSLDLRIDSVIFVHYLVLASWFSSRVSKLLHKGLHSKGLGLAGPMVSCIYSTLLWSYTSNQRQCVNQRAWLCTNKSLFIKQATGWIWAKGHRWLIPGLVYNLCLYSFIFYSLTPISSTFICFPYFAESKVSCLNVKS